VSVATGTREEPSAAAPAPAREPSRSLVITVVTAVVVGAAVLWGTDRLGRAAAESLVVRQVQQLTATAIPPAVGLRGDSFLVQAVAGRYEEVDVTLLDLSSGPLRVHRLDAQLTGVRLPVAELVRRNPDLLAVERARSRALLTYDDLDRYLEFTGRPYTLRPGLEPDEVTITGRVRVLDRDYDVSVDAVLGAEAGALTVTPSRIDTGTDLDRPAELLLGQRFTFVVPLDPLPFGQRVTGVRADPEGVVVRTETEGVVLRPR
jgi:hypothetical protein